MVEYVERNQVRDMLHSEIESWGSSAEEIDALLKANDKLFEIPAADVAPVVHAKWIDGADAFGAKRGQYRVCSRCNICIPCVSELAAPYWRGCPNCLARMDGGGK